jgi:hypothetical protein
MGQTLDSAHEICIHSRTMQAILSVNDHMNPPFAMRDQPGIIIADR